MFCPQCGQQQVSEAARFCSRCGFRLEAVAGLLATNGVGPESAVEAVPLPESPKREGVRQGGKLMLTGAFLLPAFGLLSELIGTPERLIIIGVIVFLAGLARLVYALAFEDGPYKRQFQQQPVYVPPAQLPRSHEAGPLPPGQGMPARGYVPPRADTAEIPYRSNVTEGTTRLLDQERDETLR